MSTLWPIRPSLTLSQEYDNARKREKRATTATPTSPSKKLPLARAFKHLPPSLNHHIGASTQHQGMIVHQQPSSKSSGSFISFDVRDHDGLAREAATSAAVSPVAESPKAATSAAASQDAESPKTALSALESQQTRTVDHQSKLLIDLVVMDDDEEET
ncbi:hypothetical protein BDV97DRAFT_358174, partial [Delphinella strobiligena]